MRNADVAIVGSGLAGSAVAAMLGRARVDIAVIDPHPIYHKEFRCEKLENDQIATLVKTGLSEAVFDVSPQINEIWIVRLGHLVRKLPRRQCGFMYDTFVNTLRAQIPAHVTRVTSKASTITTSDDRQKISLADNEEIGARLVVLATGLNDKPRESLGLTRRNLSKAHSISIGFDIRPLHQAYFPFSALTYFPDRPGSRMAYLSLFQTNVGMRANIFVYRDLSDPWIKDFRGRPEEMLFALARGLRKLTGDVEITRPVAVRPTNLYVVDGHLQPGLVAVGDAYSTACPAAGTGAGKALIDIEVLCNNYIPKWLATPGMAREKISEFYADPVKCASDVNNQEKAFRLRSQCTEAAPKWWVRHLSRYAFHRSAGLYQTLSTQIKRRGSNRPAVSTPVPRDSTP